MMPRVRKRPRPAEADIPRHGEEEEVKFGDVRLYLVEKKMGRSRRGFLTQLARSKGFIVEDVLRLEKASIFSEQGLLPKSLYRWHVFWCDLDFYSRY